LPAVGWLELRGYPTRSWRPLPKRGRLPRPGPPELTLGGIIASPLSLYCSWVRLLYTRGLSSCLRSPGARTGKCWWSATPMDLAFVLRSFRAQSADKRTPARTPRSFYPALHSDVIWNDQEHGAQHIKGCILVKPQVGLIGGIEDDGCRKKQQDRA